MLVENPAPVVTATQSYSLVLRDVFFDAVARLPYFANYFKRKNKMFSGQPAQLPYLGVYIVDEVMTPDGDANAGDIRFSHTLRIGFSVYVAMNNPEEAEKSIDAAYWQIMRGLWNDEYINNVLDTYNPHLGFDNPDNTRLESITRGTRRHVFGTPSANNETPLAELQYEVSCFYRSMWGPTIIDDFNTIDIKTGIHIGDTQAEMDQRQQFELKLDLTTAAKAKPNSKRSKENGRGSQ